MKNLIFIVNKPTGGWLDTTAVIVINPLTKRSMIIRRDGTRNGADAGDSFSAGSYREHPRVDFAEACGRLTQCGNSVQLFYNACKELNDEPALPQFVIGGHIVEFYADMSGIKVGCTSVSRQQVKDIAKVMGLLG